MKISGKIWAVCMLLACGCFWSAGNVSAKVCFVGDSDCAGGADFGEYVDPAADGELCKKEGYILKADCEANPAKHVTGYCPYNANYVMCCGKEYSYDLCLYPLVSDGKCGNRHKCVCDSKFPFNDNYNDTSCKLKYPGSVADGGSCVQTTYNAANNSGKTDIYFSECICNPASYPFLREDCTNGTEPSDDGCTGTDRITRYSSCICNREKYQFAAGDCEFGGNLDKKEYYCIQGGSYFFTQCYNCDAFPATSLDHVKGGEGVGYKKCTYGNRYQILQCEAGYRPGKDGDNCRELTCEEAVDEWLTTYPEQKARYTLLASPQNIQDSKLVNATSNASNIKTQNVILADNQQLSKIYAGINYYGASAFGKLRGGYMAERCKTRPNIVYTSSNNGFWILSHSPFGWSSSTKGKVKLYGLKLDMSKFNGTFQTSYGIDATNIDITARNWTIPATVDYAPRFVYDKSYDNEGYEAMPTINITGTLTIQSKATFDGVSFNKEDAYAGRGYMDIQVPASYKRQTMVTFGFKEDQEFKIGSVYMYPKDVGVCNFQNSGNCLTDYNTTISFTGPSSENPANVYTSIYLGYGYQGGTKIAHNMIAKLSGALVWNMYKGGGNYNITLSPGSKIYSTDYGSGEYARIKRGSDSKWGWCRMSSTYRVVRYGKHSGCLFSNCCGDCKFRTDKGDDYVENYSMVCSVNKSASKSYIAGMSLTSSSNCKCGNQRPNQSQLNRCIVDFGGHTHVLMNCGDSKL